MTLANKVALVTGGSQGIGEAVALRLAADGAAVAVVASSDAKKAQRVADKVKAAGGTARGYAVDVRDAAAVAKVVQTIAADFGGFDILVNAAGVFYPTPAGTSEPADVERMIDINLKGTWHVINNATPVLKQRKGGKIVNFASVAAVLGLGTYAMYTATKAGIVMLTRSLAVELAPHGINVNCIAPGNTATPMNEDIRTKPELKQFLDFMAARTPSGRTYSTAEDMAGIVSFLVSEAARSMHGSCILADEGFSAGI
jgi:NAD(P)-dependent dehydrogenase (short-subunit alcohol dehydrogenase family)